MGPLVEDGFGWQNGTRAAVSFTFDDARISQIDRGMALFAEYEIRGTFYVSPQMMEERLSDWKDSVKAGHEIGCHTFNHPCSGNFPFSKDRALENYTLDKMVDECKQADEHIFQRLGVSPVTFAYPCGQTFVGRGKDTRSYVPIIAERYEAGRAYLNESANDPGFCDLSHLTSFASDGAQAQDMIDLIRLAEESGEWVIFAGHEIGIPKHHQNTGIDVLRKVFDYVALHSETVFTAPVTDIAEYLKGARTCIK